MRRTTVVFFAAVLCACDHQAVTNPTAVTVPAQVASPTGPASVPVTTPVRLSFTADSACAALPADVRTRSYTTLLDTSAPSALLSLGGAVFAPPINGYPGTYWNQLALTNEQGMVQLWFSDPPVLEQVTPTSYFRIEGFARGPSWAALPATLTVNGAVTFCGSFKPVTFECLIPEVTCRSAQHTLTVTPQ
jgi:hypothetical protein